MSGDGQLQNGEHEGGEWDGYSDYRTVSARIGRSIDDAIDAYAIIQSLHNERARVRPDPAAEARHRILAAAMRLKVEMESERKEGNVYDRILKRWVNGILEVEDDQDWDGSDVPDSGYIQAFQDVRLTHECPDWLYDFVLDIRRAGWELGYLQAGRYEETEPADIVEADVEAMFE